MDYKQHLLDEMGRKIAEIHGIALSYQRMARETEVFLGRYEEKRSNPRRANRMPSYSERKAIAEGHLEMNDHDETVDLSAKPDFLVQTFDDVETIEIGNDLSRTPHQDLSLGRYEKALLESLDGLRRKLRTITVNYVVLGERTLDVKRVRYYLDLIRVAQRQLNATGHFKFLLV